MKQEKEYLEHTMPKHQERQDRDHLRPEKLALLEEEVNGFTMGEERQTHPRRPFENTNGKEAWYNAGKEENLTANFEQSIYLEDIDRHRGDHRPKTEEILQQIGVLQSTQHLMIMTHNLLPQCMKLQR